MADGRTEAAAMNRTIIGDCREVLDTLPERSFRCCVTSPPYYRQRDYGFANQIGLEATPVAFVEALVDVFRKVRRVLTDDGTLWLNLGDSYYAQGGGGQGASRVLKGRTVANSGARIRKVGHARVPGMKRKDLIGIPWRVALALQADGWWLRSEIIWHKPSVTPESVTDRPTTDHEHVFLLTKRARYFYNADAIKEPVTGTAHPRGQGTTPKAAAAGAGVKNNTSFSNAVRGLVEMRNARTVWTIPAEPYSGHHFSSFPRELAKRCILAGSNVGDAVLDPFHGTGTVGEVAESRERRWLGIDLGYAELSSARTAQTVMGLSQLGGDHA